MSSRTTITVSKSAARLFHAARERNGMEKSAFLELSVRAVNALTPEQRMQIQLGVEPPCASPSNGDGGQSAEIATAKQVVTDQIQPRRRRAG